MKLRFCYETKWAQVRGEELPCVITAYWRAVHGFIPGALYPHARRNQWACSVIWTHRFPPKLTTG